MVPSGADRDTEINGVFSVPRNTQQTGEGEKGSVAAMSAQREGCRKTILTHLRADDQRV